MTPIADMIRRLDVAGCSIEQIVIAVEQAELHQQAVITELEAQAAAKRAKNAERMRAVRARASTCMHLENAQTPLSSSFLSSEKKERKKEEKDLESQLGNFVCEVLRQIPPTADDASELHTIVELALRKTGKHVIREYPIVCNGRNGRIDLVVQDGEAKVAIELDRRTPKAKSLQKLQAFKGFTICITRTKRACEEFLPMIDAVIAIPPLPKTKNRLFSFPENWFPNCFDPISDQSMFEQLRDWALGKDIHRADWEATARNWKRNQHRFEPKGGTGNGRSRSLLEAFDRIIDPEAAARYVPGSAGPQPPPKPRPLKLVGREGPQGIRSLPKG
jgi:hypothetical protein